MARKPKQTDKPGVPAPPKQTAQIVSGKGTDEEIRARCAESVEGWDTIGERAQADMVRLMRKFEGMPSPPAMIVQRNEAGVVVVGAPEDANITLCAVRMVETFGSRSDALCDGRVGELANYYHAANKGDLTSEALGSGVAFVHGARASNPVEATLATQMAAVHDSAMRLLGRVGRAEYVDQVHLYGNLANKLLNTFARQAEVLAKLQRGGEQVVKHIHLDNRGGQAIVTDQVVTGGSSGRTGDQSHAQGAFGPAMLCHDPQGFGLPITSTEGAEALPHARRDQRGSAEG